MKRNRSSLQITTRDCRRALLTYYIQFNKEGNAVEVLRKDNRQRDAYDCIACIYDYENHFTHIIKQDTNRILISNRIFGKPIEEADNISELELERARSIVTDSGVRFSIVTTKRDEDSVPEAAAVIGEIDDIVFVIAEYIPVERGELEIISYGDENIENYF